ncbi:putative signaling protein [Abditibacteriota bacterium]|nr:putative signaling protein [Abditibacteriota bacterium]
MTKPEKNQNSVIEASSLQLYTTLANWRWPRTYRGKIMFVAFLGTHIPLLSLLAMAILHSTLPREGKIQVLLIALTATLVGTATTLFLLNRLLAPVLLTAQSLRGYLNDKKRPSLPTIYSDEAGALMADTMQTVSQLDDMIDYLSGYDALTGLSNRERFKEQLAQTVTKAQRQNNNFAVMVIDIDGFSFINTAFGHSAGDQVLSEVAKRLGGCARECNFLARLGGDQFALLHLDVVSPEDVVTQAQHILAEFKRPFVVKEKEWRGGASIGIALFPDNDSEGTHLLEHAESALRAAKEGGRGNYQFFAVENNEKLQYRLALGNDLYGAVERNEFVLHYQPQVDSVTGLIGGVEALVRWNHPQRGFISPGDFIPIAEATGLIVPLGEWVLRTACTQNKAWQDAGLPPCVMAVNLSARQFCQPDLVEKVVSILKETGLSPEYLELEVTESMVMDDVESSIAVLQKLHSHGIELSLDDFGTGYSSLSYLKRFPLHALKIDRSFVRDLTEDANDAVITASIIALAKSLGLSVIAEGVETQEQSDYLQDHGCHKLQGFLFSRPVEANQCARYIQEHALQLAA